MNILIDLGHPGHVHFFRHAAGILAAQGHNVSFATRDIPIVRALLAAYGLSADVVSRQRSGIPGLALELAEHSLRLYPLLRRRRIDVCAGIGGTFMVAAARLAGCRAVVFSDTETAPMENRIAYPLATRIFTPAVYPDDLGPKHTRYKGFHELAYLHPQRFTPRPEILGKYGLSPDEPYSIVRYIAWKASHDIGIKPASEQEKVALIEALATRGRVVLIPEGDISRRFRSLCLDIAPEDFHDLLAHAARCVSEGATTATEAAILGVPCLYINPIRPRNMEAVAAYGGLRLAAPGGDLPGALRAMLDAPPDGDRAARLVADHCDVTALLVEVLGGGRAAQ